jgi:PAS domain-containing protein
MLVRVAHASGCDAATVAIVALINNRNRLSPDPRSQAEQLAGPNPQGYVGDESQFANVFEQVAIAMALLGPDGRVLHANAALCRLLGLAHQQIRERAITDFMHTDDITTDTLARQALLSSDAPVTRARGDCCALTSVWCGRALRAH